MDAPSSTAGSHTYTEMDEARFLKRNRTIHLARLFLSILIFSTAIVIIACEAVTFQHYKTTSQWASAGLALWPLNYDNRPTVAALSCGCVIAFLSLIYIVAALLPTVSLCSLRMLFHTDQTNIGNWQQPYSRIGLLNTCASSTALTGFITTLISLLFIIYRPGSTYPSGFTENETLHSWTCKWKSAPNSTTAPINFSRDCHATRAGFALLCVVLALEVLLGVSVAVGSYYQRDVARRREEQFQFEKLEIATKQVYRG